MRREGPWEEVVASMRSLETRYAEAIAVCKGLMELNSLRSIDNLGGVVIGFWREAKLEARNGNEALPAVDFGEALHRVRTIVDLAVIEAIMLELLIEMEP